MDKPLIMSYDLVYSSIKTDITFQRDCIFYDIYYNEPNKWYYNVMYETSRTYCQCRPSGLLYKTFFVYFMHNWHLSLAFPLCLFSFFLTMLLISSVLGETKGRSVFPKNNQWYFPLPNFLASIFYDHILIFCCTKQIHSYWKPVSKDVCRRRHATLSLRILTNAKPVSKDVCRRRHVTILGLFTNAWSF